MALGDKEIITIDIPKCIYSISDSIFELTKKHVSPEQLAWYIAKSKNNLTPVNEVVDFILNTDTFIDGISVFSNTPLGITVYNRITSLINEFNVTVNKLGEFYNEQNGKLIFYKTTLELI